MAEEPKRQEPFEPEGPVPNYEEALSNLTNPELLSALDLALLELEKRLYCYAHIGPEVLVMADEGLVLAARTRARLEQALSSAQHAEGHLQIVGVGGWNPPAPGPPGTRTHGWAKEKKSPPLEAFFYSQVGRPSAGTNLPPDA